MNDKTHLRLVVAGGILAVVGLAIVISVKIWETWITREAWIKFIVNTIPNEIKYFVEGFMKTDIMFKGIFLFIIGLFVIGFAITQYEGKEGTKGE